MRATKPELTMAASAAADLADLAPTGDWFNDPVAFARDAIGLELWERQAEIAIAVAEHPRVAVRSSHKVGKSTGAAGIALWWCHTRPRGRVVMTSASNRQVRGILWREVRAAYRRAKKIGLIHLPQPAELPDLGMQWEDGRDLVGFTTDDAERMAGISGDELLFIVDEASGVPSTIFEAIEGNRAGGARILMLSNPTKTSGEFYDAFHKNRRFWKTIHISSEETPNVRERRPAIPGLATHEWVQEKKQEWGDGDARYQVRVLGNFPSQGEKCVIPLELVETAKLARERLEDELPKDVRGKLAVEGRLHIGVDPARYGTDDTAIAVRRGNYVYPIVTRHGLDAVQVVGAVVALAREYRRDADDPVAVVKVDVIGLGAGIADQLRDCPEVEVFDVNSSAKPTSDEEQFANLRAQLWFGVRQFLRDGGALPEDELLESDLIAPEYKFDARGRNLIESKDELRKRLGRSPDRGDAVCLAVYGAEMFDGGDADDWGVVGGGRWSGMGGRGF